MPRVDATSIPFRTFVGRNITMPGSGSTGTGIDFVSIHRWRFGAVSKEGFNVYMDNRFVTGNGNFIKFD